MTTLLYETKRKTVLSGIWQDRMTLNCKAEQHCNISVQLVAGMLAQSDLQQLDPACALSTVSTQVLRPQIMLNAILDRL